MENAPSSSEEQGPEAAQGGPTLSKLSAHQLAQMIRDLDSQLIDITAVHEDEEEALVYTFLVAGQSQQFRIRLTGEPMPSIADLYPAAQPFEEELQRRQGLVFVPAAATDNPDQPEG